MIEAVRVWGEVEAIVRDRRTGRLKRVTRAKNRLTNYAIGAFASWAAGVPQTGQNAVAVPGQTELGTGSSANGPLPTDTSLWTPVAGTLQTLSAIGTYNTIYAQYTTQYSTSTPSGNYTEAGLFDIVTPTPNLFAHVVIAITLTSSDTLTLVWKIGYTGN